MSVVSNFLLRPVYSDTRTGSLRNWKSVCSVVDLATTRTRRKVDRDERGHNMTLKYLTSDSCFNHMLCKLNLRQLALLPTNGDLTKPIPTTVLLSCVKGPLDHT